jgi:hypothetical protein
MSNIYAQYAALGKSKVAIKEKNPNRVLGGLRGSGSETFTMIAEDGSEQKIPSINYVKGLENKVREQEKRIEVMENQIRSLVNGAKR